MSRALDAVLADPELGAAADTGPGVIGLGHSFGGYTILAVAGGRYLGETYTDCRDGIDDTPDFCSTMTVELADAFEAGFRDERFTAVVPMAPGDVGLFGADGLAAVGVPVLLMSGDLDDDKSAFWDGLDGADDRWVHIAGAGHNAFTDLPFFVPPGSEVPDFDAFLPEDEVWRLIDVYIGAFAAVHSGDAEYRPLLDGPSISDDVALSVE